MPLRFLLIFVISFLLFSCHTGNQKKYPILAEKGILDLRNRDFEKDGKLRLDGEWEFFYGNFLSEKAFDTVSSKHYIWVPGVWNKFRWNDKKLQGTGFATYRLKILLNKKDLDIAMKVPDQATAYELYVNDKLVSRNGKTGRNKETTLPQYDPREIFFTSESDTLNVVMFVSNFHFWKGGMCHSIILGNQAQIRATREFTLTFEYFLAGALFLLFFYLFSLYFFRQKEKTALYFSIFSLLAVFRILASGELFITRLFPGISWELVVKIDLLSYYLLGPVAALYFYSMFKKEFSQTVVVIFIILGIIFGGATIIFPAGIHSYLVKYSFVISLLMIAYLIIGSIMTVIRKREGSLILFFGTLAFFICGVNDILFSVYAINTFYCLPVGMLVLFLLHALVLARRFSRSFNEVEDLSAKLYQHQTELEAKVRERTKEIALEKEKSEKLLLNVLPETIALRLKAGETTIADLFDEASVIFIDIVDFTKFCANASPQKILEVLNNLFTSFDKISERYSVEKIKTIGDSYMAAAGIPVPRTDHIISIANMAMEIVEANEKKALGYDAEFQFRIGLDTGPVVAGVIGEQKFTYDLWGDVVNMASRMENHGIGGKIQCTERFKIKLENVLSELKTKGYSDMNVIITQQRDFVFIDRGEIEIKNKGLMRTWFLERKYPDNLN